MKKLLLGLLALSTVAFGSNSEVSGTMNVTATIIKPLTIVANSDMEFGKLMQGVKEVANAKFNITGESMNGISVTYDKNVVLRHSEDRNQTINVTITDYFNPTHLNNEGKSEITLHGTIDVSQNQMPGNYSGELVAKVMYN